MKILRTRNELAGYVADVRNKGLTLGLVPTMGALHQGHISLMNRSVAENDRTLASVFVNPTQFNDKNDLLAYPRTEDADFALLEKAGVDAVFAPSVEEIYPPSQAVDSAKAFDLGEVAEVMEGAHRPGHFQGVAQIVSLLFDLVRPHRAYFGEKDFQQIAVIRRMAQTEGYTGLDIVACPIHREADGLAMSSRNVRLTESQRAIAPGIYAVLAESVGWVQSMGVDEVQKAVVDRINRLPECEVEYYSIVQADTLQPAVDWNHPAGIVGCITVYCGKVRLIDNIAYTK